MEKNEKEEEDADKARLSQLGYKQELRRSLSLVENFAVSFSIISVLTGITTTYNTGLRYGGPVSATMGWPVVSVFNGCVALSMAEICSAYPTSGGLYYWSAKLAGDRWAPLASWVTGWFNIVGQCSATTSIDFSLAQLVQVMVLLSTGGANGGGYAASKYAVLGIYGAFLIVHGIINSASIKWVSIFCNLGAIWNVIGVFLLTVLIPVMATERASPGFVFSHFNKENGEGIHNNFYIFVLGLLMSQYTMGGYDASVHMTEETKKAAVNGPKGIISSVAISTVFGYIYLVSITFAVKDIPYLISSDNDAGGYAIAQVFFLVFKNRYGSGVGGIICIGFVAAAVFFCGISALASNSRMAYAFSRDGAMPFSSLWCKVNKEEVPANAVWLAVSVSFCMAITSLGSVVAFQAMVSIATIGTFIAYALPILLRVTLGRKTFVRGPFSLGRCSILCGWVAVLWVATITILFSLPVAYPIKKDTLNYAPLAVGGVLILILSSWVFNARHWFKGPITNIQA